MLQTIQTRRRRSKYANTKNERFPQSMVRPIKLGFVLIDVHRPFFCFLSMYEKLISRLGIDEIGTNFPQVSCV